jgi:hypothetical protein
MMNNHLYCKDRQFLSRNTIKTKNVNYNDGVAQTIQ